MRNIETVLEALGIIGDPRFDAATTAVIERELKYVKTKTYDVVYPEMKARQLIPVSNEASDGDETITYRQWDDFGMAVLISNYADDLPLIETLVTEFTQQVHSIGDGYQYSIQDLRRAAKAGNRLDQRRAMAARKRMERKIEDIGALGETRAGLYGIANNPNVGLVTPDTGDWLNVATTGDQKIADLNKLVTSIVTANKGTFFPDTILLDIELYNNIANSRISTTGDTHTTVLEAFLRSSPYITSVEPWNKLALADAAGTGPRAICYKKDPEVLTLEIPKEPETFPPQQKNLAFFVPNHARIGGVIVYYPIAMGYMDGLTS